jgi:hypothetical protein
VQKQFQKTITFPKLPEANTKYQIPNTKYQIPETKFQIPNTRDHPDSYRNQIPGRKEYIKKLPGICRAAFRIG